MSKPTISDEARIAIAFCALKYKPRGQTFAYAAYVLDLHAKFPSASETPPGDTAWRERVLGLEQDLALLQTKYDQERIKALLLKAGEAAAPPVAPGSNVLSAPQAKKTIKRKSHPNIVSRTDLQAVLSGLNRDTIPAISTPQTVFSSFDALVTLTELADDEKILSTTLLAAATGRALEDLGVLLRTLISHGLCSSTSAEMLKALATLLSYLITAVLPLFISRLKGKQKGTAQHSSIIVALEEILGQITTLIFIPLARSFGPLSLSYTTNVFSNNHAVDGSIADRFDIRSDLCCLVRQAISDLDHLGALAAATLVHTLCGTRKRLALEAVREMEKSFLPHTKQDDAACTTTPDSATTDTPKTRIARIHKLARKDTLWYLCSMLYILFTPSSATSAARLNSQTPHGGHEFGKSQNKLLEDAILTGLSNIIARDHSCRCFTSPSRNMVAEMNEHRTDTHTGVSSCGDTGNGKLSGKCQRRTAVDEVGHGMILAVIERAWLYWFDHGTDVNQFIQP